MKRRKFFKVTFLGISTLLASGVTYSIYSNQMTYEKILHAIIVDELSFLSLDKNGINDFCRAYAAHEQMTFRRKIALRLLSFPKSTTWLMPSQIKRKLSFLRVKIIETYLFSTNFFQKKKISSNIIYIAYYDPLTNPCANPFAILR